MLGRRAAEKWSSRKLRCRYEVFSVTQNHREHEKSQELTTLALLMIRYLKWCLDRTSTFAGGAAAAAAAAAAAGESPETTSEGEVKGEVDITGHGAGGVNCSRDEVNYTRIERRL